LASRYTQVPIITEAIDWCRAQLSEVDLAFVRGCDHTRKLAQADLLLQYA
jgi:hypothetical protein